MQLQTVCSAMPQNYIIINAPANSSMLPVMPAKRFRLEQTEILRCKRRDDMTEFGYKPTPPTTVARRNERERNRVKHINKTFQILRQHLPLGREKKKMSKVDTLKNAIEYIHELQDLLEADGAVNNNTVWDSDEAYESNSDNQNFQERIQIDSSESAYCHPAASPSHSSVSEHAPSPSSCNLSSISGTITAQPAGAGPSYYGRCEPCVSPCSYDPSFSPGSSTSGSSSSAEQAEEAILSLNDSDLLCLTTWLQQ